MYDRKHFDKQVREFTAHMQRRGYRVWKSPHGCYFVCARTVPVGFAVKADLGFEMDDDVCQEVYQQARIVDVVRYGGGFPEGSLKSVERGLW